MQTPNLPPTKRERRALRAAQIVWLAVTATAVIVLAVNLPFRFRELSTFCAEACAGGQLPPSDAAALAQLGLSLPAYAVYTLWLYLAFGGVCAVVAGVLAWRRWNDATAVLASMTLIAQGATSALGDTTLPGAWDYVLVLVLLAWYVGLVNLLYLFPDGHFVPRWTRWAFVSWVGWLAGGIGYVLITHADLPGLFWVGLPVLMFGVFVLGGVAQLYRYRRVSTPTQRQQTKWVVAGFAIYIATELLYVLYSEVLHPLWGLPVAGLKFELVHTALDVLVMLVVPLSIGGAILRYRLWDIDLVIRRTLVYTLLTALLAAAYFASVAVLQSAAAVVTGERQSALVTVLSTLLIAALFAPVRLGVQGFIDRRFFRSRYDAAHTLAVFAATLRDDADLAEVTDELLEVVERSMQPEHATLWVRRMDGA
jgi:hypothetical protein